MMMMMLQRTGLLKMLDVECSVRGCPETYVQKVKVQHKDNSRYQKNICGVANWPNIRPHNAKGAE